MYRINQIRFTTWQIINPIQIPRLKNPTSIQVYPDQVDQSLYIADGVTEAALRPSPLGSLVPGLPRVPSSRGRLQDLQRTTGGSADLLDDDDGVNTQNNGYYRIGV